MKSRKVAIIGGGVGMLSVLDHLNRVCKERCEVSIFMRNTTGVGEAYKFTPDQFIMNTRNDSVNFFNHIINYLDWLNVNFPKHSDIKSFTPRRIFGVYLNEIKKTITKELIKKEIIIKYYEEIKGINDLGLIKTDLDSYSGFDCIFVSVGFATNSEVLDKIRKIKKVKENNSIKIIGSGLSAIDWIILTNRIRPDVKIEVISRSGFFPSVRSDFSSGEYYNIFEKDKELIKTPNLITFLKKLREECLADTEYGLIDFRNLIKPHYSLSEEISIAKVRIPLWQPLLYRSTNEYSKFFSKLPSRHKRYLLRKRSLFINRRGMFPLVNAEKIQRMIDEGIISIKSSCFNNEMEKLQDYINCTNDNCAVEDFLRSIGISKNELESVPDNNFRACEERNLYLLGPITNSVSYFTEASSLTHAHAGIAVSDFLNKKWSGNNG